MNGHLLWSGINHARSYGTAALLRWHLQMSLGLLSCRVRLLLHTGLQGSNPVWQQLWVPCPDLGHTSVSKGGCTVVLPLVDTCLGIPCRRIPMPSNKQTDVFPFKAPQTPPLLWQHFFQHLEPDKGLGHLFACNLCLHKICLWWHKGEICVYF